MKSLLQPKYILIAIVAVAAVFVLMNELKSESNILLTGSEGGRCPVHDKTLRLDTVSVVVKAGEADSAGAAYARANYPMANTNFEILEWFKDDEHKNLTKAQVWYCPQCREFAKEL